jgi:adenylate kinase
VKYRSLLLFGAPGSGKGTQGKILGAIPHFFHFACGDVFRRLQPDSDIGRTFIKYSSRGQLVPDKTTIALWRESIGKAIAAGQFRPGHDTLVLDGIPRNVSQAEMLRDTLDVTGIYFLRSADLKSLVVRIQHRAIKENRFDDVNLSVIRQRLKTYEKETKPLLKFYGKRLVHEINADQTPGKVLADILRSAVKR